MGDQYGFESREKFHRNFMYPNDKLACAGQNQKEFLNLDIWMLSYEALYSSKIQKMMSLYCIVENFFVLKKYNPIHQPRNLVMLYKRARCGVTFFRVWQGPAKRIHTRLIK